MTVVWSWPSKCMATNNWEYGKKHMEVVKSCQN